MTRRAILVVLLALGAMPAAAEPHFAVREGLRCAACHVNPGGGGLRNAFGNAWAQSTLPADAGTASGWTGMLSQFLAVGGNARTHAGYTRIPNREDGFDFDVTELRFFADFTPVPRVFAIYLDQQLAPGGGHNREALLRVHLNEAWYLRAGQMYLPYGLRLEDDGAFVRQIPGINFTTPDRGVELGWESAAWSAQLAVSNGTAGAPATGRGKQVSLRAEHVLASWRLGASFNYNDTATGSRRMQNLFAGVRTGPVAWLAQIDYLDDASFADGRRRQWIGLLEANWSPRRGHNLKLGAEFLDPDRAVAENERNRYALVWEHTPMPFLQLRSGLRLYDGIPQNDLQNRRRLFVELHGFF